MNHSNPEVAEIASVGNDQTKGKAYQRPFSEQPQASLVRHSVGRVYRNISLEETYVAEEQRASNSSFSS